MSFRTKSIERLRAAIEVLTEHHHMTVRQVYYQLVARQIIENSRSAYQAISKLLVKARQDGLIAWGWIEDRLRRPRTVSMWSNLSDFAETAKRAYKRDVWATQPNYIEVWLEKDALSGIFENVLATYGITLNVGRGFDGWTSIKDAALRYELKASRETATIEELSAKRYKQKNRQVTILYFGDFDPSGEDMARSLKERIAFFGVYPKLIKCALTKDDIERYKLPPDFAKKTDSRAKKFIAKHGDVSVELDALPVNVLRERLISEIENIMDMEELQSVFEIEAQEKKRLVEILSSIEF